MARANKYSAINFNDVYEKKLTTTSSSASAAAAGKFPFSPSTANKSYSFSASSRSHGMLVLSRPSPKPQQSQSLPPISPRPQTPPSLTDPQTCIESDAISLRPLGKTGSGPLLSSPPPQFPSLEKGEKEIATTTATPKANKFVPPHLRPGFVAKKESPIVASGRGVEVSGFRPGSSGGLASSPTRYGEDRRPKSGGGHERVTGRRGYVDLSEANRPRSSGNFA